MRSTGAAGSRTLLTLAALGVALAAALPELPYACGLNTGPLLADDPEAPFVAERGVLRDRAVAPEPAGLARVAADAETEALLLARLRATRELSKSKAQRAKGGSR